MRLFALCLSERRTDPEISFGGGARSEGTEPRRLWRRERDTEGVEGSYEWGEGILSPPDYGVWGIVVSSPIGVRDGTPADIEFCKI